MKHLKEGKNSQLNCLMMKNLDYKKWKPLDSNKKFKNPPEKEMTRNIYRSFQKNDPPKGWVQEELIQPKN